MRSKYKAFCSSVMNEIEIHFLFRFILQSQFCQDKRSGDKYGMSSSNVVLADSAEVIQGVMDGKVNCTNKFPRWLGFAKRKIF